MTVRGVVEVPPVIVTGNVRLPPSFTVGVPLMFTVKVGGTSVIVPVPDASVAVTPAGNVPRLTMTVSLPSTIVSGSVGTVRVPVALPAGMVTLATTV